MVLRHLALTGSDSRAAIAAHSGLTRTSVSRLTSELIAAGLVYEVGTPRSGRTGRPGTLLAIDGRHVLGVGAEVNVDCIRVVVRDLGGREVQRARRPLDVVAEGAERALRLLAQTCNDLLGSVPPSAEGNRVHLAGIGVAVPALTAMATGVVTEAPNLHWQDVPVGEMLAKYLGYTDVPIFVGNDGNFGALAEHRLGANAGASDLIYVTGEAGIGAGVIAQGALLLGARGYAGEVGHVAVEPGGPLCGCGRRGCWEARVGLGALFDAGESPTARRMMPETRVKAVVSRAGRGERDTLLRLEELGHWVGVGVGNLVNIFGTELVILGGYFVPLGRWILPSAHRALAERAMVRVDPEHLLTTSELGFDAAMLGASTYALEAVFSNPSLYSGVNIYRTRSDP